MSFRFDTIGDRRPIVVQRLGDFTIASGERPSFHVKWYFLDDRASRAVLRLEHPRANLTWRQRKFRADDASPFVFRVVQTGVRGWQAPLETIRYA